MPASPSPPTFSPLAAVLADADAPPTRVVCTGGVVWVCAVHGAWHPAGVGPHSGSSGGGADSLDAPGRAAPGTCDLRAVERWLARHDVRPVALATPAGLPAGPGSEPLDGSSSERLTLASAAAALGWRPPLERLAAVPAYARIARHARPVVDAVEHHALDAITRYAAATATAARVARLHDAPTLATVGVAPGLFVAVDALAASGLHLLDAAATLAARAFGPGRARAAAEPHVNERFLDEHFAARVGALRGAPATLRAVLLEVWAVHSAPAARRRRALLRHAAAALGPPTVRVRRLRTPAGPTWAVEVPVERPSAAHPHGVDGFEAAWTLATEAARAFTLALYAAIGEWSSD